MSVVKITPRGHVLYPVAPLAEWLRGLIALAESDYDWRIDPSQRGQQVELSPRRRVANWCGLTLDTLNNYTYGKTKWIDERDLDAIFSSEMSTHIAEVYPEYRKRPVAVSVPNPKSARTVTYHL